MAEPNPFLQQPSADTPDGSAQASRKNRSNGSAGERDQADQAFDPPHPKVGALLAWLFPGAGHLYQGRVAKGLLYMGCLVPMFLYGMFIGGGKVAFASPAPLTPSPISFVVDRWQFVCQAGIGAVALPAMVERERFLGRDAPLFGGWFYPPFRSSVDARKVPFESIDSEENSVLHPSELAKWQYDYGFSFELGSIVTAIAGLLNLLVVYDAHSGPLVIIKPEEKSSDSDADEGAE